MDLAKPLILVMSPTVAAAKHLVYSMKMNGFENLEKQMLHGVHASLASDLSQDKHVIID